MINTSTNNSSELQEQLALLKEFLSENYDFRHNVLSDVYEIRECNTEPKPFRPYTREARNTLIQRIKCEGLEIPSLSTNLDECIISEETPLYDPIKDWLQSLPAWDGKNHIGELFGRIPDLTTEQHHFAAIWIRSAVAHWLDMDQLHGNENVVTLIGAQGCGKSTFCARILPPFLRNYYLDHINLSNKNDKEMALASNLLVNLDELDQIKPKQQAELKQTLSKAVVNGRPIYGRAQKCRKRYASFVSTTNNLRPLNDPTGSRRFICIRIPDGKLINNEGTINYEQLYAQVLFELREKQMPYWFTPDENQRIEQLNYPFQRILTLEGMIETCFRRPKEGEVVHPIPVNEIAAEIIAEFPNLKDAEGICLRLGKALKAQNYERKRITQGSVYYIVPKKKAA